MTAKGPRIPRLGWFVVTAGRDNGNLRGHQARRGSSVHRILLWGEGLFFWGGMGAS